MSQAEHRDPGACRPLAGLLLLLASALHVAAIFVPFVEMRALVSTATYGLIPSVLMLLDYGMVVLAVLVIAFSIVFPFAKLTVLWRAWAVAAPSPGLGRVVRIAESLGKWSMLDVFLVLLLLVVTHDRTLVATRVLPGVPLFMGGVLCTMLAGEILARRWPWQPAPPTGGAASTTTVRGILGCLAVCLVGAQLMPLLQTDSALLSDRSFNLVQVAWALVAAQKWGMAAAVAATLLVLPWLALIAHWLDAGRPPEQRRGADGLRRWTMLDVFGLALAIFIIESDSAVPSDLRLGAVALGAAIALSVLASWRLRR